MARRNFLSAQMKVQKFTEAVAFMTNVTLIAVKRILMIPLNDSPDEVRDEVLCQMIKQVRLNDT